MSKTKLRPTVYHGEGKLEGLDNRHFEFGYSVVRRDGRALSDADLALLFAKLPKKARFAVRGLPAPKATATKPTPKRKPVAKRAASKGKRNAA